MQNENIIILIGQVGNTPEYKNHNGTKVAKFPLATTNKWKDKKTNEIKEKTTWHNIVAFGFHADYVRDYVVKGAQTYVNGSQDNFVFEKEDGEKIYGHQVVVNRVSADRYEKKPDKNNNSNNSTPPPEFPDIPDDMK